MLRLYNDFMLLNDNNRQEVDTMSSIPLNEKVARLIQYINELSQLKQKTVSSYKNYDEILWVSNLPEEPECIDAFRSNMEEWLYVKKPVHPVTPIVPQNLQDWLTIDFRTRTFNIHNSIITNMLEDDNFVDKEEFLEDNPDIKIQIHHYKANIWDPYVEEAKRVEDIQALYDKLFKMHQNLQLYSESMELVVSTGLLHWKYNEKDSVERHLLTSEVELQFNREKAEFTIVPTSKGKTFEYEEDMLLVENRLSGEDSKEILNLLLNLDQDNEFSQNMISILQSIVHALDSKGTYIETLDTPSIKSNVPTVSLSPAFVLRKKTQKGFQKACQTAVEQLINLTDESQIPSNLSNMFLSSSLEDNDEATSVDTSFKEAQEFYFPLPSNEEQNRIISTLNSKSSVLVQGPPGTGKTHTIANLTSHLLATGQRVLITSQTAKALGVLKSKLPTELQDLSVSLLGGDSTSLKDLEKVVNSISTNKELFDLANMASAVSKKETDLKKLKSNLNKTKTELMEIREEETYEHHFNSLYKGTAQQIAEKVNQYASTHNWYTTPVTFDTSASFCEKEKNLVTKYIRIKNIDLETPDGYDQFEYPSIVSDFDLNIVPDAIKEEIALLSSYKSLKENEIDELQQNLLNLTDNERIALKHTLNKYKDLQRPLLFTSYPSLKKVISDFFSNRGYVWEEIVKNASLYLNTIKEYNEKFDEQLISSENITTAELKKMAEDLHVHVSNGGSFGNFIIKPKIVRQYKIQLQKIKYNGIAIKSTEQIGMLYAYAQTKYAKEQLEKLFTTSFMTKDIINPMTSYSEFQNAFSQLKEALNIQLWRNNILKEHTFLSMDSFDEKMYTALCQNIEIFEIQKDIMIKSTYFDGVIKGIMSEVTEQSHPLYKDLVLAIQTRDNQKYNSIYAQYKHFQEVMQRDHTINTIYSELITESVELAKSLEETYTSPIWDQRLNNWQHSFEWKQTQNWIQQFSMKNESTLSKQYDQIEKDIKDTIIEIGTAKAWISMLSAMTDTQSKHLKAWARAVKSIGKNTGKNAPRYRADAQMHMEKCIEAIPAWIMPLNQVYDNFEIRPNLFDVVIIDEASQSWHDALLLKYLAKKLIIVGDDKQISPTIIGITDEDILKLQNKFFKDIDFPFGRDLNLKTSFFDVAYIMFKDTITLQEHFRCMPEIIGFSNRISYQNKPLIPLRQYPANRLEPINSVYLPHGVREGSSQNAYNEVEAEAIVLEIKNCIKDSRYVGKTFGVISLLGPNQAKLIQNMLLKELGAEIMEERKIICGDAYAFQGDERDIIFLSMVVAKGTTRITAAADDKTRQRFNVAVSRAKDQLWVMHSISVNDISNRDCLRYQLLSYIADPLKEETESNREKCESKFELNVFDAIVSKGYRVIPQYNVANYRIDLVIQGEKSKLAVECDGDHWHTSVEDRERDFLRERVLQRAGWTFWRVLGSTYYNNPEKALESLWEKVEEMGIQPYLEWRSIDSNSAKDSEIIGPSIINKTNESEEDLESFFETELGTLQESDEDTFVEQIKFETLDLEELDQFQPSKKKEATKESRDTLKGNTKDHLTTIIKEMKLSGFDVIDYRDKSKTIYVIGGRDLEENLKSYRSKGLIFRFFEKGNRTTKFRTAWYAKIEK
jgi:very-short-patch-repair endonuclease